MLAWLREGKRKGRHWETDVVRPWLKKNQEEARILNEYSDTLARMMLMILRETRSLQ